VGVAAAAPGLRVLLAAIVAAVLAAAAVVVEGAATGSTQAATGPAAQSAGSSAAPSSATPSPTSLASAHVPLSARTDPAAVAELASSRRRAVSRDSARRVQAARADRELERTAEAKADARRVALAEIDASAERRSEEIARNTWVRPIASGYRLTATFGQCSGLWSSCHTGLDLAVPSGTPIHSVAAGRVTETGYDGAYGNKTVVTLEDGTELWYCHQTSVEVSVGDTVAPGQQIGTVGSTGNTTGPHLHLEVHPGAGDDAVDPAAALAEHGVAL
jgi:murein DD-endopeptidase MepM/ murein hydrolase activator NlpD